MEELLLKFSNAPKSQVIACKGAINNCGGRNSSEAAETQETLRGETKPAPEVSPSEKTISSQEIVTKSCRSYGGFAGRAYKVPHPTIP